jgi:GNAT superfamily N-acetyltransferase
MLNKTMAVIIKKVSDKKELRTFIRFNYELYKDNPYSVPDLYDDMLNTFSTRKNAAFEFCEADYFLAYKDDKLVGRVAAIINRRANETWNKKEVRFGWIDFIDDLEVSKALLDTVEKWGKERGMEAMVGPLGFTDMDAEGMLVEGFDQLGTMATIYNYPYYPEHMQRLGLEKEADWVEFKLTVPDKLPEKFVRISEIILQKYKLKIKKLNRKELKEKNYGQRIFDLINEAYAPLYGYSKMTQRQIDQYVKMYLPLIDLRMVSLVENEAGELVAVGISMPSLSEALQKAKGKMLPFGWFHLLKALFIKKPKVLDLLLVGVKPEYQSKGVNALLFYDLVPVYQQMGFKYGESNPELEVNKKVQAQWTAFESVQHKRRRAFKKVF